MAYHSQCQANVKQGKAWRTIQNVPCKLLDMVYQVESQTNLCEMWKVRHGLPWIKRWKNYELKMRHTSLSYYQQELELGGGELNMKDPKNSSSVYDWTFGNVGKHKYMQLFCYFIVALTLLLTVLVVGLPAAVKDICRTVMVLCTSSCSLLQPQCGFDDLITANT